MFGTLCALDRLPSPVGEREAECLCVLARLVAFELDALGRAEALERERRSREAAEAAERRAALLARASGVLGGALCDARRHGAVARAVVAAGFARAFAIDLVPGPGMPVRRAAVAHADRARRAEFRAGGAPGLPEVLELPLAADGREIGALVLARREPFEPAERRTAEDLAARIAAAVEQARLYARAHAAVRAREEFLQVASHELKDPVIALRLHHDALARALGGARAPAPARKVIGEGASQIRELIRRIDALLDVSRIAGGRLEIRREPTDLAALVGRVAARFAAEHALGRRRIRVAAPGRVAAAVDRFRVEQVVTNLLSNAVKYGRGKPVEVRVEAAPGVARIAISDRGIGIPAGARGRIFERFERAAPSEYGGLGLGLYIASEVVRAHGGRIAVESALGVGSTFTVELPAGRRRGGIKTAG